ncbi:glutathione S-transferase family protein [Profundibacterium mesophilum]|uniref:Glutathione S-transferase n=1 Tax=Profundibacterium mesophilum KAUST100406-0324 TaxID=1037889 RepID=A0A921TG60_9RHOB|nr:glutathione S-transferase family protein [Profundibacterium mesophilum]KAF0677129.1 Glutathione S-transferase [Profundibacterium mesophilum KAUST100406-0324]
MTQKLTFFLARGTISVAPHIVLEELGLPYEPRWIDLRAGAQRGASYLEVNPKGRVPALSTPQGVLTETHAILVWLASTHPDAGLLPADPWERARIDELALYLAATMHVAHAHFARGGRWADDADAVAAMKAKAPALMAECCAVIEARLNDHEGPWATASGYTIADPYLYAVCRWLKGDGVAIADYPALAAHHAAMAEREAVKTVEARHA